MAKQFIYRKQPTDIFMGDGILGTLGEKIHFLDAKKAILITDKGLVDSGIADQAWKVLNKANIRVTVFTETHEDPGTHVVQKVRDIALENKCDVLIGLGGGSCLDTAKAASILLNCPGSLQDYGGMDKVPYACTKPPVIAIPTTSGTGSEVSKDAVITDDETGDKFFISSTNICPAIALVDPELTLTLPPALTAATGMDALTHAIESYTNRITQPISQSIALKAIELISKSLAKATFEGSCKEARYNMSLASLMAGMAFTVTRLGLCHAIYLSLGSKPFNISHGVANGIMLSHVMKFNAPSNPSGYRKVAEAMNVDCSKLADDEATIKSAEKVSLLAKEIGMPSGLKHFGITENDLPYIAKGAFRSGGIKINPRPVTKNDIMEICRQAL